MNYPISPLSVPEKFTTPSTAYQLKSMLAILGVILFFILYFSLVIVLGWLVYIAFTYQITYLNKWTIILKIGAILGSAMLFTFTLKFIFKLKNVSANNRIALSKDDYPILWDFVYKICEETGAPKPRKIYVDPDVNAYVAYSSPWLSLFLPVPKDLTVGMGLVECLNLTEFKAVISHEFGHFAQRSMKVGSYIMTSNTIIHDMIYNRDKWDEVLEKWRSIDLRLSAAAWLITPIIWIIRQILALFSQLLNIMYSSLSREMEFNADKYAVKTSGSDAICSSLWKLESGFSSWNQILNYMYLADKKGIYIKNIYEVFENFMSSEKSSYVEQLSSLPEHPSGGKQFFTSSELSKVSMYASHPPNVLRENNAKNPYLACEAYEEPAWTLFNNPEDLQIQATALIYDLYLNKTPKEYCDAKTFIEFIASENMHTDLLKEFFNSFETRFLEIPKEQELIKTEILFPEAKELIITDALKTELQQLLEPVRELEKKIETIQAMSQGTTKIKTIDYEGQAYSKRQLSKVYELIMKELEKLRNDTFKDWDIKFCETYYVLSKRCGKDHELLGLYKQHRFLTNYFKLIIASLSKVNTELISLQQRSDVSASEVNSFGEQVNAHLDNLNKKMETLKKLSWIALPNLQSIDEFLNFVVEGGQFKKGKTPMFENGEFNRIFQQLQTAQNHCQRVDLLSVGAILSKHKEIETEIRQ